MSRQPCDLARHVKSINHPPVARPSIVYQEWNKPVLQSALEYLLNGSPEGTADLRDFLLMLPTRQAGRRLTEALAWKTYKRGGGLFPPMTATPWRLVQPAEDAASELACLWHWERTLAEADLRKLKSLFPRPPANADLAWRRGLARQLHELRGDLVESGLDFAAVAEGGHCPEEAGRWRDLKKLEAAYRKALGPGVDRHDAKRAAAESPVLPPEIRRVMLLGVPDLPLIVQRALEKLLADDVPMEVVVFGPADGEGLFDEWGRPLPEQWQGRELTLVNEQLGVVLDEGSQADVVAGGLGEYSGNLPAHVAVGVADPAVMPPLERVLADAAIPFYNPHGHALRHAPIFIFLKAMHAVLQQPSFAHAEALLRLPDAWGWAEGCVKEFSPTRLLNGLDVMREKHLPARLADAANFHFAEKDYRGPRVLARDTLRALETELARIEDEPLSVGLASFLQAAFAKREFTEGREEDAPDLAAASQFMDRLAEWEAALGDGPRPPAAEVLALLLEVIGREVVHPERPDGAVDIQGWLELAWEDAPHLVVAGANEGLIPESIHGDVFLPETLRERLGLRTNAVRLARDAWLLELLLCTRAGRGRVDFLLGQQRANGDPLKPSRLLFNCSDDDLPERVGRLFPKLPPGAQPPAWKASWPLQTGEIREVEKVSVTAMGSYLECPYRFYLRQVLGLDALDLEQRELDARGFGSLMHSALEEFGLDPKAIKLKDPEAIYGAMVAALDRQVERGFGKRPPLALRVQAMTARSRLYQAAHVQAAARAEGWEIIQTEDKFKQELDGLLISGVIDRVEKNSKTGAVRVLDYKTSNTAKEPAGEHWRSMPREYDDDSVRPYARFSLDGKEHCWTNLQLPMYAWAVEAEHGPDVAVGYFNLPAIGTDTGIALLEPFDRDLRAAALTCARGVVADLQAKRFWPPAPKVKYDNFEGILFGQPENTAARPGEVAA